MPPRVRASTIRYASADRKNSGRHLHPVKYDNFQDSNYLFVLGLNHQAVVLPSDQVEQLVARFGPAVRSMGFYVKNGDGSVEIPMSHVTEAVQALGDWNLAAAVSQLKSSEEPAGVREQDSARRLIETLAGLYLRQFKNRVERFQDISDPAEADRLWGSITRDRGISAQDAPGVNQSERTDSASR